MKDLMKILGCLAIVAILISIVMSLLAMIGSVKITDGCLLRYDPDAGAGLSDSVTNSFMLDAAANYSVITTNKPDGSVQMDHDPNKYGDWLNSNMSVVKDQQVKLRIEGEISLCKGYLPKNNIQQISDLNTKGKRVEIPRVEEVNTEPVSLIFDSKTDQWRNIAELYPGDRVVVSILPNQKSLNSPISVNNAFEIISDGVNDKNRIDTAECSEGKTSYSPLCGRYSIYSGEYVNKCEWKASYYNKQTSRCAPSCIGCNDFTCFFDSGCCPLECSKVGAYASEVKVSPEAYKDDGSYSFPWSNDLGKLLFNTKLRCTNTDNIPKGICPDPGDFTTKDASTINGAAYQNNKRFWYTAPTGLLYRKDNSETPTAAGSLGSGYKFAKYDPVNHQPDDTIYNEINNGRDENNKYLVIYNETIIDTTRTYLQYRLWSGFPDYSKNTGGYVLNIKQTKCRRTNGSAVTDPGFANRGKVQYVIVPYDKDLATCGSACTVVNMEPDREGKVTITMNKDGYLWMRILNKPEDYKDSYGRYKVQMFTSEKVGSFTLKILNPLFQMLRTQVQNASIKIFKNMTCYGGGNNCSNFFTYIKLVLILYVMTYGAMFILGIAKINQQDLLIRIAKIAIVSGLMNGNTFEFFNTYIINFISNFSDGIISNMSGYSMFSTTNTITNPFMFLDALMSKIFFGKTFSGQLLSFLSLGLSGLIYFIIVFIAVMIVIITALRAIAVYVMAFMAVALLIGIAPLFLTFMLFDFTRYLFDNWIRFTFRYMIEPVILMAGIIVMTQLFTIYLDYALGFSVCWKCALPIKMPFISIPGFNPAFVDVPIFCINWFAPWGMDYRSGMLGVNMQHFIALIMIAYGMYGYVEFSSKMVVKLTNGTAGPSATQMGKTMSDAMENKALKEVGLDKNSRKAIKANAKKRLTSRNKILDKANKARSEGKDSDGGKDNDDGGSATPST